MRPSVTPLIFRAVDRFGQLRVAGNWNASGRTLAMLASGDGRLFENRGSIESLLLIGDSGNDLSAILHAPGAFDRYDSADVGIEDEVVHRHEWNADF